MTNQDLEVIVHRWCDFGQAWLQKLLSTMISAKILVTVSVVVLASQFVHSGKLTGADWASLMKTVVVAFLGARIAPKLITSLADLRNLVKKQSSTDEDAVNGKENGNGD